MPNADLSQSARGGGNCPVALPLDPCLSPENGDQEKEDIGEALLRTEYFSTLRGNTTDGHETKTITPIHNPNGRTL